MPISSLGRPGALTLLPAALSIAALTITGCSCPKPLTQPEAVRACLGTGSSAPPGCLRLKLLGTEEDRTGNIRVSFQVVDCEGRAYAGLDMKAPDKVFTIKENERPVSAFESQVTILPRRVVSEMYTVLLLDLSDSVRQSKHLASLKNRAKEIIDGIVDHQQVALAAFDGRPGIQMLQDFTSDPEKLRAALEGLGTWKVVDPSTNLYGAYMAGLKHIRDRHRKAGQKLARGSLILITDGSDQAGRRTRADAIDAGNEFIKKRGPIYAIGVGGEIDQEGIKALGMTQHYAYGKWSKFDNAAISRIIEQTNEVGRSFYVLSYCSPKRAGRHKVKVALGGHTGSEVSHEFIASEFTGKCDSKQVLKDCNYVQCGGGADSKCHRCPDGQRCADGRCLGEKELSARLERTSKAKLARARAKVEAQRTYNACLRARQESAAAWKRYGEARKRRPARCR